MEYCIRLTLIWCSILVIGLSGLAPLLGAVADSSAAAPDSIAVPLPPLPPQPRIYQPSIDDGTPWRYESKLKKSRLTILLAGFAIGDAIGFAKIADLQYNTETSSFHFHEWHRDSREYKQMDKIGHTVEAYYMSHLSSKIYRWSGLSAKKSIWLGSLTGLFWMTQIEVTDGFFKAWGFSYLDYTANILGVSYAALQQLYPNQLQGIRFKASFWPSTAYKEDQYSTVSKSILDDYEGFTWWLAVNIHDVLPQAQREAMPGWLKPWGVAVGHGVRRIAKNIYNGNREIYLGLDFDVTKIPTGDSNLLKFIKHNVNFIRMPLPAVRITPSGVWYGLYF